jgi:YesN/AraC family two-component response regulator
MPEMDGFTCCERLRSFPHAQDLPILMITFLDDQESIDKAFKVGASDYITKPINWQVLRQRINRLINYHQLVKEKKMLQAQVSKAKKWEKFLAKFLQEYSQCLCNKTEFLNILKMIREYFKTDRVIYIQTGNSPKVWESVRDGFQVLDRFDLLGDILKNYQHSSITIIEDISKNSDEKISTLLDYIDAKSLIILPVKLKYFKSYFIFINENARKWKTWELNQINNLGIILSF